MRAYARHWGEDEELYAVAGLLHDFDYELHPDEHPTWGVAFLREHTDTPPEVLDAIRYHTSGRPGMTLLEKVICVADYVEPNRDYDGVIAIRNAAERSLEEALLIGMDLTIRLLMEKQKSIFLATIVSRNAILAEWKSGRTGQS